MPILLPVRDSDPDQADIGREASVILHEEKQTDRSRFNWSELRWRARIEREGALLPPIRPEDSDRWYSLLRPSSTGLTWHSPSRSEPPPPVRRPLLRLCGVIREQSHAREYGPVGPRVRQTLPHPLQCHADVLRPGVMGEPAPAVRRQAHQHA